MWPQISELILKFGVLLKSVDDVEESSHLLHSDSHVFIFYFCVFTFPNCCDSLIELKGKCVQSRGKKCLINNDIQTTIIMKYSIHNTFMKE